MSSRFRLQRHALEKDLLRLEFIQDFGQERNELTLEFALGWKNHDQNWRERGIYINDDHAELADLLLTGLDTHNVEPGRDPADVVRERTASILVSLANMETRELLYQTLNTWSILVGCPLTARMMERPGFPVVAVLFDTALIAPSDVDRMIETMLAAIAHAETTSKAHVTEADDEEEEAMPDADRPIVEDELDPDMEEALRRVRETGRTEYASFDEVAAGEVVEGGAARAVVPGQPPFIDFSVMYAVHNVAGWTRLSVHFPTHLALERWSPEQMEWLEAHLDKPAAWCHPTPEAAYRVMLGDYAKAYTDDEVRQYHPNFQTFVRQVETDGGYEVLRHPQLGYLVVVDEPRPFESIAD